jgi:tetratricopeptide (TPR) repeat protein
MSNRSRALLVALLLAAALAVGVFAFLRLGPSASAVRYWLGVGLVLFGATYVVLNLALGREHPLLQQFGAGSPSGGKKPVRDGLIAASLGAAFLGLHYADRYVESVAEQARFTEAMRRGVAADREGDLEGAVGAFSEAVGHDPASAKAHFNLGLMLRKKGDLDGALRSFGEAIRLDPAYARAYRARGEVYRKMGDAARAASDLEKAAALDPNLARPAAGPAL